MAGRKLKPASIKALQGTYRKDRANDQEPKPELKIPPCPSHLADGARLEWDRICQELHNLGLLTGLDVAILAGYCAVFDRWAVAEKNIQEKGAMIITPNGYEQPSIDRLISSSPGFPYCSDQSLYLYSSHEHVSV